MKELLSIFPPKVIVKFGDKEIEIKSVELQDMSIVATISDKLFSRAIAILQMKLTKEEQGIAIAKEIIDVLKNDTGLFIDFLSATTTVEKETLKKISIEAGLFLITEVIEVNKDFLYQKVMPMIKDLAKAFDQKSKKTNG